MLGPPPGGERLSTRAPGRRRSGAGARGPQVRADCGQPSDPG